MGMNHWTADLMASGVADFLREVKRRVHVDYFVVIFKYACDVCVVLKYYTSILT